MRFGSLFSGIGGLDLGLERAGMSVSWQCEIDPYCRAVLAHHWPGVPCWDDIRAIDESAERVDLICGGFPCQPVSLAGKGLAQKDPRWLWPEFARVVGLLRPRYVLVENVPGLVRRGLSDVIGDLAAMGYDAEWQIVSAASVGAPHLRERLFVVAYPNSESTERGSSQLPSVVASSERTAKPGELGGARVTNPAGERLERPQLLWQRDEQFSQPSDEGWWLSEPDVGRVAPRLPSGVAQLRALGNAVVPQVAEFVGRLILQAEEAHRAAA